MPINSWYMKNSPLKNFKSVTEITSLKKRHQAE